MTLVESIVKDLEGLPAPKLVEIARYVHKVNVEAQKERQEALRESFASLSEEDARAFEEAMSNARRIEVHG